MVADALRHAVAIRVNRRGQSRVVLEDFASRHHGDRVLQREARPVRDRLAGHAFRGSADRDRLAPMTPYPTCRHGPQRQLLDSLGHWPEPLRQVIVRSLLQWRSPRPLRPGPRVRRPLR